MNQLGYFDESSDDEYDFESEL